MVYMVVGHDGPRPLAAGTLNSFPASVQVKPGDVLGLNSGSPAQTACGFQAAGDSHLYTPTGGDPSTQSRRLKLKKR
jgi:hypothetical protein